MAEPIQVTVSTTPNPQALKFTVNREVWPGRARTVNSPDEALGFPLAARLLTVPGVKSLFFLRDFITVTRAGDTDWETITDGVTAVVTEFYG